MAIQQMIAIGIVAHTSRVTQAKALNHETRADFISIDNGLMGCDDNHEHVQHHLANLPSTWSIILEDDAQPVNNFRQQATAALLMAPAPIVSFYLGRKRPSHWQTRIAKAVTTEAHWLITTHLLHAVGYAIKTDLLPSLLNHTTTLPVDQHIGHWARTIGHPIAYTNPSLVDHLDQPTLVNHPDKQTRTPGRKAWNVGTRTHWTTETVPL